MTMTEVGIAIRIALGSLLIVGVIVFLIYLEVFSITGPIDLANLERLPPFGRVLAIWATIGIMGIWVWMLTSYFRQGPGSHRVLWGWMLFLGSYLVASIYFFLIYIPQIRRSSVAGSH